MADITVDTLVERGKKYEFVPGNLALLGLLDIIASALSSGAVDQTLFSGEGPPPATLTPTVEPSFYVDKTAGSLYIWYGGSWVQ